MILSILKNIKITLYTQVYLNFVEKLTIKHCLYSVYTMLTQWYRNLALFKHRS
jgi:hypothetical protein